MFSSSPTPTTARPAVVADVCAGQRRAVTRIGDRRIDVVEHDGALLKRGWADLEQHLGGVAAVGDQQLLQ